MRLFHIAFCVSLQNLMCVSQLGLATWQAPHSPMWLVPIILDGAVLDTK